MSVRRVRSNGDVNGDGYADIITGAGAGGGPEVKAFDGKTDAVVRESADLLYNLTVLWASAGVRPVDVWREMERREHLLGIAEKMPKSPVKLPRVTPPRIARRPIVALESRSLRKRH